MDKNSNQWEVMIQREGHLFLGQSTLLIVTKNQLSYHLAPAPLPKNQISLHWLFTFTSR